MSTSATAQDHGHDHAGHDHAGHDHDHDHADHAGHPTDLLYIKVAAILAILTGVEVFTYFKSVFSFGRVLMPMLIVLMGVKFYLIAAYFMHLKFEQKILRRAFTTGIVLATFVYVIALLAFKFFTKSLPH